MSGMIPSAAEAKEIVYDSFVTTCGAIAVTYGVKKPTGKNLGVPMTLENGVMLASAIAGGTVITRYLKSQKLLPEEVK